MKLKKHLCFFVFYLIILSIAGCSDEPSRNKQAEISNEIDDIKQEQSAIRKDLEDIKQLLKSNVAKKRKSKRDFKPAEFNIKGAPYQGEVNAPITLVEFTDYQCPFCKRYARETYPELIEQYVKTGKLKYVVFEYPIVQIHPHSHILAQAAFCAAEQNKFWEIHEYLLSKKNKITLPVLIDHTKILGLNSDTFEVCINSRKYTEKVDANIYIGKEFGVNSTPSFILGYTNKKDKDSFYAKRILRGALPLPKFKGLINLLFNQAN